MYPSSGVVDYLSTEISTSKQKKFPLVTFVDTPGLVDGDMNYPFGNTGSAVLCCVSSIVKNECSTITDVNQTILWLGDLVDLIFVFFDPIGQVHVKAEAALERRCIIWSFFTRGWSFDITDFDITETDSTNLI